MDPETQTQAPPADAAALDALSAQIEDLTTKAADVIGKMEAAPNAADFEALKQEHAELATKMAAIEAERSKAAQALEVKRLREELNDLKSRRASFKHEFSVAGRGQDRVVSAPFPVLVARAKRGDPEARKQLAAIEVKTAEQYGLDTKALGEGAGAAGGYLVPPEYIQDLVLLRRATAPLLDYVRRVPVKSNLIYVPQQTTVSTVGWTAENATKPSTDEVLGQLSVNVFTLAGIAKVSNQLLEDSSPAVDGVVRQDLMRGVNIEMDRVVINGSGTGQPTGILNTSGVTSTATTVTNIGTVANLLNDIILAVSRMQQTYFGQPDAIVFSPRTWGALMTSKDTTGRFLLNPLTASTQAMTTLGVPAPTGATQDNMGLAGGALFTFAGIPIVVDANMPVNLGGSNSAVIVGAFREAWWLARDDVRMDVSSEAGTSWESNQTWFRGEVRMGFTAARLTSAFQIISGVPV